ncbi:hypothetical protein M595_0047 [Lyngbya aestuarii BL J]|uniref:Uncharacterized protein n=2 Tax=Lyngbya aestuarii TaxID=118322 RepID=U7QPU2_9CYAN|nr:hypothetical protein M595_0047 [Lyngbya aestuarii BL J]
MAIAMITALSLQAHAKSQNRQLAANLESDFESLTECKTSEMKISNQVGQ